MLEQKLLQVLGAEGWQTGKGGRKRGPGLGMRYNLGMSAEYEGAFVSEHEVLCSSQRERRPRIASLL